MGRRRLLKVAASLGVVYLTSVVAACSGSTDGGEAEGTLTKLSLGCIGDELAFDQSNLTAPAGAAIELTFRNHSKHHQHNWVLINGGEEVAQAVYEAALAAGAKNDWLPPANPQIIAQTPLLASGSSVTISFHAPAQAGNYLYLCTFPGHYLAGMKGTLTIR